MSRRSSLIALAALGSCHPSPTQPPRTPDDWYALKRARVETLSALHADSTRRFFLADSAFIHDVYYKNGRVFREEWRDKQARLQGVSLFTSGGWELRTECCPDSTVRAFEGLLYKRKFYGPVVWRYCNGQVRQSGLRFEGREIGIWRRWDEAGRPIDSLSRGGAALADSLWILPEL